MTLPSWLVTAVSWAVVGTGAAVLLALCLGISIACMEYALRRMGLWRDVTKALFAMWAQRERSRKP